MKNLILLALICFSVNAACAEGERIFSVVANETTTAEGAKSTLYFNHEPGAINLPDRTRGERIQNKHCVLINDRGALSKQIKRLRNFSLYNPVKYHAEIDGANAKAIISPLEGSIGEFSSFNARLYIALYPDAFIEALRCKFADGKNGLKISDDSIKYSDLSTDHFIQLNKRKIVSVEMRNKHSGEKLSDLLLHYTADGTPIKSEFKIYAKGKVLLSIQDTYRELKNIADSASDSLFDTRDLGPMKFYDSRVRPQKTYIYAKGIPSVSSVKDIPEADNSGKKSKAMEDSLTAPAKSKYLDRAEDFFAKFYTQLDRNS